MHYSNKVVGSAIGLAAGASAQLGGLGGIVGGVLGGLGTITNPIGGVVTVPLIGQPLQLGAAAPYGVFAGAGIASTGTTIINSRIGVSPGAGLVGGAAADITGFPPGVSQGQDDNTVKAVLAKADILTAYTTAQTLIGGTDFTGVDLGGRTVGSGSYVSTGAAALTGTLILDAQGNANAAFVFKVATNFVTAAGSQIVLANGASACNVYFQIGNALTLGANSVFNGVAYVQNAITAGAGANVGQGALYSLNGAVTLAANQINIANGACKANVIGSVTSIIGGLTTIIGGQTTVIGGTTTTLPATTTAGPTTTGANGGTTTVTTTVTNAGSTTTVTASGAYTSTVAPYYDSCTSTTTHYQPKYETKTAQPYACNKMIKAREAYNTKYVTSTCAAYTQTHYAGPTQYASITGTYTRTHWSTYEAMTTYTSTEQPACTNGPMIKRDYLRMFE